MSFADSGAMAASGVLTYTSTLRAPSWPSLALDSESPRCARGEAFFLRLFLRRRWFELARHGDVLSGLRGPVESFARGDVFRAVETSFRSFDSASSSLRIIASGDSWGSETELGRRILRSDIASTHSSRSRDHREHRAHPKATWKLFFKRARRRTPRFSVEVLGTLAGYERRGIVPPSVGLGRWT